MKNGGLEERMLSAFSFLFCSPLCIKNIFTPCCYRLSNYKPVGVTSIKYTPSVSLIGCIRIWKGQKLHNFNQQLVKLYACLVYGSYNIFPYLWIWHCFCSNWYILVIKTYLETISNLLPNKILMSLIKQSEPVSFLFLSQYM